MYKTKTNCYIALEKNGEYYLRYVQNELPLTQFYNFLLNGLNKQQDVETLFNLNSDISFLHHHVLQMNAEKINDRAYYKKIGKNEELLSQEDMKKKIDSSPAIYCVFQDGHWHAINYKVLDTYTLLDFTTSYTHFERMIPLKYLLNAKHFASKKLDKKQNLLKYWSELKNFYLKNIMMDNQFLKAKYIWWNNFIMNKNGNDEPEYFQLLKIEIEKDQLENSIEQQKYLSNNKNKI